MSVWRRMRRVVVPVVAVFLLGIYPAGAEQSKAAAADESLSAFISRIEAYARVHQRLEAPLQQLETARDPLSRLLNKRYLASAIRAARRHARQGDIFTPDATDMFRRQLAEVLPARDMAAIIVSLGDESGQPDAPIVNEPFDEETSHAVPPFLLQALPPLPGGIEYRVVGTDLVLWDVHADIMIDVYPTPSACRRMRSPRRSDVRRFLS